MWAEEDLGGRRRQRSPARACLRTQRAGGGRLVGRRARVALQDAPPSDPLPSMLPLRSRLSSFLTTSSDRLRWIQRLQPLRLQVRTAAGVLGAGVGIVC